MGSMSFPMEPFAAAPTGRLPATATRAAERERLELRIRRLQSLARGLRLDAKNHRPGAARVYRSHAAELEAQVLHLQELAARRAVGPFDVARPG
jgi:hypothetical protein